MPTRTDIKAAIVTALKAAGNGPAGNRVYIGRQNVLPSAATDFPLAYVYMLREDMDTLTMGASDRHQNRVMMVAVDFWFKAGTPEPTLDTACAAIELLVSADTDLGNTCKDIVLTSTEYLYDGTEETPFGRAALQYRVTYFANEP